MSHLKLKLKAGWCPNIGTSKQLEEHYFCMEHKHLK